jgi:5-methylcytosine-specific restriction endonuclease McrA
MLECPTCGREFDSQRGLGVHHSQVHDELLPNRECHECGAEYHSEYEKKYCSDECREAGVSFEGENHPNYSNAKEETECKICDERFKYYPSAKEGLFCSSCVEEENWRYDPDVSGRRNPRWNGGKRTLACSECGSPVERHPWNINSEHVFCSGECQSEWLSETFTGEGHPNWKGGVEANYGKGWNRVRRQALERDGYECVLCGTAKEELGRNPDVHHIVPVRAFVETPVTTEADAHYLENVVSLCPSCHRKAEFGHIDRARLEAVV